MLHIENSIHPIMTSTITSMICDILLTQDPIRIENKYMNKKRNLIDNFGFLTTFAHCGCKFFILTSFHLKGFFNNCDINPTTLEASLTK